MSHERNDPRGAPAPEALERYLAGESMLAERERVDAWMRADPANRARVEALRALGAAWAQARSRFDSRAAWRRVAARTGAETPSAAEASHAAPLGVAGQRTDPARSVSGWGMRGGAVARRWIAAAIVVTATAAGLVAPVSRHAAEPAALAPREYITAAGQQIVLTLPDGTRVRLAPKSKLSIDSDYGRGTRTVQLVGQAHLEVTHDEARPFRVRAGTTVAWDLGTRFTIRAYEGEDVRVAVEDGSVAIPQALAAPLLAGDVATIDARAQGSVEHHADMGRYTAWLTGTLEFRDTPLLEVAADLSRWYGVDVRLGDRELARRRLSVAITESSIDTALELVAPAVGARYERHGRTVTLRTLATP